MGWEWVNQNKFLKNALFFLDFFLIRGRRERARERITYGVGMREPKHTVCSLLGLYIWEIKKDRRQMRRSTAATPIPVMSHPWTFHNYRLTAAGIVTDRRTEHVRASFIEMRLEIKSVTKTSFKIIWGCSTHEAWRNLIFHFDNSKLFGWIIFFKTSKFATGLYHSPTCCYRNYI